MVAARAVLLVKILLSISLFTLHQIAWNPDKHRGCERWRVTHLSSPLFTTLHLMQEDKRWAAYLSRSSVIIDDQRWSSMMAEAGSKEWSRSLKKYRWREVKSGEECIATLHPCKPLIYSWLCRICEEWRVFLKVSLYSLNSAKLLRKMWEIAAKLLRKMWVFNIKLLCKMW